MRRFWPKPLQTLLMPIEAEGKGGQGLAIEKPTPGESELAEDLMRRIVAAIDQWAAENELASLPREIIFEQALAIMTAFHDASESPDDD